MRENQIGYYLLENCHGRKGGTKPQSDIKNAISTLVHREVAGRTPFPMLNNTPYSMRLEKSCSFKNIYFIQMRNPLTRLSLISQSFHH